MIGTMNLLAAAGAAGFVRPRRGGQVVDARLRLVLAGPDLVPRGRCRASRPARSRVERSLVEVEGYLRDFAEDNPHVIVTLLRFANVLGTDIVTPISRALQLPLVPCIFGFDPLLQFVEEDDVVRSIEFATRHRLARHLQRRRRRPAARGARWRRCAASDSRRCRPWPPSGPRPARARSGVELPQELLDLLRYGRGVDNRRLKEAGFEYRYTSAGAVRKLHPGRAAPAAPSVDRAAVPLRAGRRAVLPPLARRRSASPRSTST